MDTDIKQLFEDAGDYGEISPEVLEVLQRVGIDQKIKGRTGLSIVPIEDDEVILVALLIDDSQSIGFNDNQQAIIDGHNACIAALKGSTAKHRILFRTQYMDSGYVLNDWVPLMQAKDMSVENYRHDGMTPLNDSSVVILGSVLAEIQKASELGKNARSAVLIVTDGKNEPSKYKPEECNADDVATLVKWMTRNNTADHYTSRTVSFMGIKNDEIDHEAIAQSMGIGLVEKWKWIITPKNTPREIRRAFDTFSRENVVDIKRHSVSVPSDRNLARDNRWLTKPDSDDK